MPDPKSQLVSFPLNLGMDNASFDEGVQPGGEAPKLARSINTRLTKVRGIVSKAPGTTAITSGNSRMGGMVPAGRVDSSIFFQYAHEGGSKRVAGSAVGSLPALNAGAEPQNNFFPARISRAGGLPAGATSFQTPATCWDSSTGYTYYASLVEVPGGSSAIAMTVLDDNGRVVVATTRVVTFAAISPLSGRFVGLSAHGPGIVRLWYKDGATNAILGSTVTVSSSTLDVTVGAPVTIYTPSSTTQRSVAIAYDPLDTSNLYMVCFRDINLDTHLMRIDPVTMTVSASLNHNTGGDANTYFAIAYVHDGTAGKLIWMASWAAGNCHLFEANPTNLLTIWSATNRMWNSYNVSCGFFRSQLPTGIYHGVFASGKFGTTVNSSSPGGTMVELRELGTGNLLTEGELPWHVLIGQIATHKVSNTEYYPLFPVEVLYSVSARYSPVHPDFITDPSIEVYRPHYSYVTTELYWSCLARVGTDFSIRYPSYNSSNGAFGGLNNFIMAGQKAKLCYLAENLADGITFNGHIPRYADIDFTPTQPAYAHLSSGQAIIAGALPAVWDGSELTELAPIRAPKITGVATGGAGSTLTGDYLFAAVYSWKDAAGEIHRSPPSNIITLSPAASKVMLYVTKPISYRNGATQGKVTITLYASQAGGTTLYAQSSYLETTGSSTDFWAAYEFITTPAQNAFTPALYTDAGPTQIKTSSCPNACSDVAVIGDRVWLIDPERPARAFFSQPLSTGALQGIFPSFNPSDYVDFPASAGQLVAVTNFREAPLFLTSTGIYTIDGEGPDALGNGAPFSPPRQISDHHCTSRISVIKTPAGTIFLSGDRFILFNGEARPLTSIKVAETIVGTAVFKDQQETVWYLSNGRAWVFNYLANDFTQWDRDCLSGGSSVTWAAQVPATGAVVYCSPGTTVSWRMDPNTVSTSAQIVLESGWTLMGGPQDDNRVSNVILHGYKTGSHNVAVSLATDYDVAQPLKSYSNADLVGTTLNSRYDLSMEPKSMAARAVKWVLTESGATGEGFQPVNLTLEILKNPGKLAASIRKSGRK